MALYHRYPDNLQAVVLQTAATTLLTAVIAQYRSGMQLPTITGFAAIFMTHLLNWLKKNHH